MTGYTTLETSKRLKEVGITASDNHTNWRCDEDPYDWYCGIEYKGDSYFACYTFDELAVVIPDTLDLSPLLASWRLIQKGNEYICEVFDLATGATIMMDGDAAFLIYYGVFDVSFSALTPTEALAQLIIKLAEAGKLEGK